ncbi:MAG TPA: hypothetical protein VKA48_03745, partial [Gammaproteobacteria bacterium]|nr:hypothetical protein [Gammaproteobacteria bacterium]
MWVFKFDVGVWDSWHLSAWLEELACFGPGQVVIVPGGWICSPPCAEEEAPWVIPGRTKSLMRLHGMAQYSHFLLGLRPDLVPAGTVAEIRRLLKTSRVVVWLPEEDSEVWGKTLAPDTGPDSLGLRLAQRMKAERLVLVKRAYPKTSTVTGRWLVREGLADKGFAASLAQGSCSVWI